MPKFHSRLQAYLTIIAGLLMLVLGLAVLFNESLTRSTTIWLPALLILGGLFALPANSEPTQDTNIHQKTKASSSTTLVAVALLITGVYLLLRDFGVISVPVLRYVLGFGFIGVGLYGLIGGWMSITSPGNSAKKQA